MNLALPSTDEDTLDSLMKTLSLEVEAERREPPEDEDEPEALPTSIKKEVDILDSLLSESMYAYQANAKAKQGRKLSPMERETLSYQDSERNWSKLAIITQIENQVCSTCGADHSIIAGWYLIMQHKNDPTAKRLQRIDHWGEEEKALLLTLPVKRNIVVEVKEVCGYCVPVPGLATDEEVKAWGLRTLG